MVDLSTAKGLASEGLRLLKEARALLEKHKALEQLPSWYEEALTVLGMLETHDGDSESARQCFEIAKSFHDRIQEATRIIEEQSKPEFIVRLALFTLQFCLPKVRAMKGHFGEGVIKDEYVSVKASAVCFQKGFSGSDEEKKNRAHTILGRALRLWAALQNREYDFRTVFLEILQLYEAQNAKTTAG